MEAKLNMSGISQALFIAYKAVMELGYSHQHLVNTYDTVNYNTLRRISNGKGGKSNTDWFYLRLFVSIIYREYLQKGKSQNTRQNLEFIRKQREIMLVLLEIDSKTGDLKKSAVKMGGDLYSNYCNPEN